MLKVSILDYSPVDELSSPGDALTGSTRLAKRADELGFKRFWVSEHHGMKSLAGSNPDMLMMHLAAHTKRIRIGSGGVMLSHYSAYKVAEGFKLMEALYPGRIDLGVGRAAGADHIASAALNIGKNHTIPYDLQIRQLKAFLTDGKANDSGFHGLIATPQIDTLPEMWSLGAGIGGSTIAAMEGTSYIFAHFINPTGTGVKAISNYLDNFKPSFITSLPQTMVAVFVSVAETDEMAEVLAKAFDHWLLMIESGRDTPVYLSPVTIANHIYTLEELQTIKHNRRRILVGSPKTVKKQIIELTDRYSTNEIMILPNVYGAQNRMRAIELMAGVFDLNQ